MSAVLTISQLVTSFKAIRGVISAQAELQHFGELDAAVSAAYSVAIEAQSAALEMLDKIQTLTEENSNLKNELNKKQDWIELSKDYSLKDFHGTAYYAKDAEPSIYLCAHCFANRKISMIQPLLSFAGRQCPDCKTKYNIG